MSFSFSAFGAVKVKRTVSDVFRSFTSELEEIQAAEKERSDVLRDEIQQRNVQLQESLAEQGRAESAIANIKQLFGG